MLNHHIQKQIVQKLLFEDNLRFSELKIDGAGNKLFDYHLKIAIRDGYVEKNDDGYSLTNKGKQLASRQEEERIINHDLPNPVLFLAIRKKDTKEWLLYRRNTHPLKDRVGFMHCALYSKKPILDVASDFCKDEIGITCSFKPKAFGYFRIYDTDELESYTNFTLLYSEDAVGEIDFDKDYADYFWVNELDLSSEDMLPNMSSLVESLSSEEIDFIDVDLSL